jgi:hypothetical protein
MISSITARASARANCVPSSSLEMTSWIIR